MGFQILRCSLLSKPLISNPRTPFTKSKFSSHLHSSTNYIFGSGYSSKVQFRSSSSSKPIFSSISPATTTGFGGLFFQQNKRRFSSEVVVMATPGSVQKSDDEWRAVLSPEQFRILREKGTDGWEWLKLNFDGRGALVCMTGIQDLGNTTSSLVKGSIAVQDAGHPFINQLPNLTLAVGGQLSLTVSLEPLLGLRTLMEGELRLHAPRAVGTLDMSLKVRGSRHLPMNVIVSIVFLSRLFLHHSDRSFF